MSKDRLMCKHCANTDMKKMTITEGGKYLYCHMCNAATPLYDAYVVYKEDLSKHVASLVSLGQHLMDTEDYDHAVQKFKEALDLEQTCHAAWWGQYVCERWFASYYQFKDNYGNSGPVVKAVILDDLIKKYASMAIETAPDEIADLYCQAIAEDQNYIRGVIEAQRTRRSSGIRGKLKKLLGSKTE